MAQPSGNPPGNPSPKKRGGHRPRHYRGQRQGDAARAQNQAPPRNGPRPAKDSGPRPAKNKFRDRQPKRHPRSKRGPTLGQKLLRILTFGLISPGGSRHRQSKPPGDPSRPGREPHQPAPVAPSDPDAILNGRIHVGNLAPEATESDLRNIFNGIGKVARTEIVYSSRTYQSKGCGFVEMMRLSDARRAVAELHGQPFMGRPLLLGPALPRGEDARESGEEPA